MIPVNPIYMRDLRKLEISNTLAEEKELFKRIKAGDRRAQDKIIKANLRLVRSMALDYIYQGVDVNDLISAGNIGLIKALKSFETHRGWKFISYAVWWIRQSIFEELAAQNKIMKLTPPTTYLMNRIKKVDEHIYKTEQRRATIEDYNIVIDKRKVTKNRISKVLAIMEPSMSLDASMKNHPDLAVHEAIKSDSKTDSEYINQEKRDVLLKLINELSEDEQFVIKNYYGVGVQTDLPLTGVTAKMGKNLSRERMRQLREQGLKKLRHKKRFDIIKELTRG